MSDSTSGPRVFRGTSLNPQHTRPLADAIGGLLVNFGWIEVLADAWLHCLSTDSLAAKELQGLRLNRKIESIRRFLTAGRLPAEFAQESAETWKAVAQLAEVRNQVAHNPVFFGWRGEERDGPPDFAGVLDRRKSIQRVGDTPGLIPLSDLTDAQNRSAALAQQLGDLVNRIGEADAWPPEDPAPPKAAV
jgi:hypothetical protein